MKLMTEELKKKFEKFPLYSQDGLDLEEEVVVKYFSPFGGTWLITEGEEQEDGDWELFGYCSIGYEFEWGYVMLSELENVAFIERDLYCEGKKVKDLIPKS